MSDTLINLIKRHTGQMDSTRAHPSFATVVSYNPADHTAKVILQPEGEQTNWIPVLEPYTSAGRGGVISPPEPGQQVFVAFEAGSRNDGVVLGGAYSQQNQPPLGAGGAAVQPGEIAMVSGNSNIHLQRGALTVTAGGNLALAAPSGAITLTSSQPIQHNAPSALFDHGIGVFGHAAPASQPARPGSVQEIAALLASYGLCS